MLSTYLQFRATLNIDDFKGPVLHIGLDGRVVEFSADESLSVENSVGWVNGDLKLKVQIKFGNKW